MSVRHRTPPLQPANITTTSCPRASTRRARTPSQVREDNAKRTAAAKPAAKPAKEPTARERALSFAKSVPKPEPKPAPPEPKPAPAVMQLKANDAGSELLALEEQHRRDQERVGAIRAQMERMLH
jgi:hypothetical protein